MGACKGEVECQGTIPRFIASQVGLRKSNSKGRRWPTNGDGLRQWGTTRKVRYGQHIIVARQVREGIRISDIINAKCPSIIIGSRTAKDLYFGRTNVTS